MSTPFDINELRSNIGEDMETERRLLTMFMVSCTASLQLLQKQFPEHPSDIYNALWKKHMHQIKGASLNLGANDLCQLTAQAQHQFEADFTVKKMLLEKITAEFEVTKKYINQLI